MSRARCAPPEPRVRDQHEGAEGWVCGGDGARRSLPIAALGRDAAPHRGSPRRRCPWTPGRPTRRRSPAGTPPVAAFAEYGRVAKTEHLLRVVDLVDDTCRRQMNRQLTVEESRHKLARDVCHGKRGTIHQAYRGGDQLGALGLVLNAIVLRTRKYIDAAVAQLQAEGHETRDEDIARLSPLKHRHLNLLGRYGFTAAVGSE
nr:transposase [Streptomyces shenzhenensis]